MCSSTILVMENNGEKLCFHIPRCNNNTLEYILLDVIVSCYTFIYLESGSNKFNVNSACNVWVLANNVVLLIKYDIHKNSGCNAVFI